MKRTWLFLMVYTVLIGGSALAQDFKGIVWDGKWSENEKKYVQMHLSLISLFPTENNKVKAFFDLPVEKRPTIVFKKVNPFIDAIKDVLDNIDKGNPPEGVKVIKEGPRSEISMKTEPDGKVKTVEIRFNTRNPGYESMDNAEDAQLITDLTHYVLGQIEPLSRGQTFHSKAEAELYAYQTTTDYLKKFLTELADPKAKQFEDLKKQLESLIPAKEKEQQEKPTLEGEKKLKELKAAKVAVDSFLAAHKRFKENFIPEQEAGAKKWKKEVENMKTTSLLPMPADSRVAGPVKIIREQDPSQYPPLDGSDEAGKMKVPVGVTP